VSGPTATVRGMTTRHSLIALAAVVLAACGGEPETPPAEATLSPAQVLPNIAMPPGGEALGSEGGSEAATLLISTPMVADSVAEFYRGVLSKPPYRLINESVNAGITSFYVEQDGPPMWITVEGLEAGGTLVRMSGAIKAADSTAAPTDTTPAAP
jgi:hypothetical protein